MTIKTPSEVLSEMSDQDRKILNMILAVEKKYLHESKIKPNSRLEKDVLNEIVLVINGALPDEN